MKKLELKYLAGYLPYRLKAQDIRTKEIRTVTLLHFTYGIETVGHNHLIYDGLIISKHLPILTPLSDLTKEIEVDGEKFVPLEKMITKAIDDYDNGEGCFSSEFIEEFNLHFGLCVRAVFNEGNEFFIRYYKEKKIFSLFTPQKIDVHLSSEYLEKLYEWHFDIHGLIEKGLAIDINTLNQ